MHLDSTSRRPSFRPLPVLRALSGALALGAALACSSGGSSSSTVPPGTGPSAPAAAIAFPPPAVVTDDDTILVRGTASSSVAIDSVKVQGVDASTSDGFATWEVVVPLALGVSQLTVRTEDADGRVDSAAATLLVARVPELLANPVGIAYDASRDDFLLFDSALAKILRVDGQTAAASDFALGVASARALATQTLADRLLVTASELGQIGGTASGGVLAFPLAGGGPTQLTGPNAGSGPRLDDPLGIAINAGANVAYVADGATGEVFEVRLSDGLRTILTATGDAPASPAGVAYDPLAGGRVVVGDRDGALFAIELTGLTSAEISGPGRGLGPAFVEPLGVRYDPVGMRYLVADAGLGAIFAVDPATGDRTVISGPETGGGTELTEPVNLVLNGANRLFVADAKTAAMLEVDLASGSRSVVFGSSLGTGPLLARPRAISFDELQGFAYVGGADAVYAVRVAPPMDGSTGSAALGERRVVSGGKAGQGVELGEVTDLVRLPELVPVPFSALGSTIGSGARNFVTDLERLAVLSVDDDGARRVVSDASTTGPMFTGPRSIAFLPDSFGSAGPLRAVVGDYTLALDPARLIEVDLEGGGRSVLSGPSRGAGPDLARPAAVVVEPSGATLWVVDVGANRIVRVDAASGDREQLPALLNVPSFAGEGPADAVLDASSERMLFVTASLPFVLAVDLASGEASIVSNPVSTGPRLLEPVGLAVGPGDGVYVLDQGTSSLLSVDSVSGSRVLVSR